MTAERIDYTTGEVVATMTEPEARRATERIRTALDRVSTAWQDLAERVADAYARRADLALGYGSWAEYTQAEFNVPTLATEVRRELVSLLSAQGMSTRAIAPVVGVSDRHVRRDVQQVGHDVPPEHQDPPRPSWPPTAKPDPAAMPTQNASTMRVNPAVSSATTATPGPSATAPTAPAPRCHRTRRQDRETSRPGLRVAVPGRSTLAVPDRPPDALPGAVRRRGRSAGVVVEVEQAGPVAGPLGDRFGTLERDVGGLDAGRPCRELGVLPAEFGDQGGVSPTASR